MRAAILSVALLGTLLLSPARAVESSGSEGQHTDEMSVLKKNTTLTGYLGRVAKKKGWECLADRNCPTERPICSKTLNNTKAKTCVQCLSDDDCPEYQRPCNSETNKCKDLVVPVVSLVIRYDGITVAGFTDADKAAVCANLLTLAGLTPETATCTILTVLPGSVIVLAEIRTNGGSPEDFAIIENLTATLTTQTQETLALLTSGVSGNPTASVDSVEKGTSSIDTSQPPPVPPTAPTNAQATFPANGQCIDNALVSWTAPSSDGGASIATYVVACSSATTSAALTASGSITSAQLGPLAPSTTYRCGLTAVNAAGASPASEPTPAFSTPGVPGQPSQPTTTDVINEPSQRSVSWGAATTAGTCPLTGSTVVCTSSNGGATTTAPVAGAATTATVTGLTLGKTYTCNVTSTNVVGSGQPSLSSLEFSVAFVVPSAPLNVQATFPANNLCVDNALVSWARPTADGGDIGSYVVTCTSGSFVSTTTVVGSVLTAQVGLLQSGQSSYTCTVVAENAAGSSPSSAPSSAFSTPGPPGQPSQPTTTDVINEPSQRSVSWGAATTAGTCPLTGSTVVCSAVDGATVVTTVSNAITSATVSGLTLGANYTCNVTSQNGAGFGLPSANSLFFWAGCSCANQNITYVLLPQPAVVNLALAPYKCWYKSDMRTGGTADIVSLASDSGTYPTLVSTAPAGTTSALKMTTATSNTAAKAQVSLSYGSVGALAGTPFKTLVADTTFAVKYDWYKAGPCTAPACNTAAAPYIKLVLYSAGAVIDGTNIRGNYNTLVWEPSFNDPYSNGALVNYLKQWRSQSISALLGTNSPVTGANGENKGWWETSSGWGAAQYRVNGGGTQRNLAQWSAYYSSLSSSLDDAVIVEVQVAIGSGGAGLITYANNVELVAATSLSNECVFEAP